MRSKLRALLLALPLMSAAAAAAQNFQLGVSYSELIPTPALTSAIVLATAADSQGAIYILASAVPAGGFASSSGVFLTKLAPAANQVVYQTAVAFPASSMAVDSAGNVYLAGAGACPTNPNPCSALVQKIGPDGSTVLYAASIATGANLTGIAVDPTGRAYVTGFTLSGNIPVTPGALQSTPSPAAEGWQGFALRLKSDGAIDYATYLGGLSPTSPVAIAADAAGSAFITGFTDSAVFPTTPGAYLAGSAIPSFTASFLLRLSPDGSSLTYSTFTDTQGLNAVALAVDASDNAVVALTALKSSAVLRFNPEGTAITLAKILQAAAAQSVFLDAAGNIYVGLSAHTNFTVQNSIATCDVGGSFALAVLDPDGGLLQSTYIPGSQASMVTGLIGTSPYFVGAPDASYLPTRQIAGSSGGGLFLSSLAPGSTTTPVQLACVGNAANYAGAGISGGELVSLFGQGIGPANGTQPAAIAAAFPQQLANVQVTFNGIPGPLLYVQDGQINAIAPWALQPGGTVNVCVVYNGAPTNCIARPTLISHPGVFTTDGTFAAALNQDGTINSAANPAAAGSTVSIFATGLGPLTPTPADGAIVGFPLPTNVLPDYVYWLDQTFLIGALVEQATVTYSGPAPFEVAGVSQINFVLQEPAQPYFNGEYAAPFFLQAGGAPAQGLSEGPIGTPFAIHVAGPNEGH